MGDSSKIKKIEYLKNTDFFSSFSTAELKVIAGNSSFKKIDEGVKVFLPGDSGNQLFVVEYGEVVINKRDNENRDIDIARFIKGDCFGELDMLTGSKRNASAAADIDTRLLIFPKNGILFEDMLEMYPEISARILHKFIIQIAGRIRKANSLVSENSPVVQELNRQVYSDKLTSLYNKTYLEEKLKNMLSETDGDIALIMLKPDNFKAINDSYGHDAGDQALRIISKGLVDFLPSSYILFRYMGNELSVLMPDTDRKKAFSEAERIMFFLNNLDLSRACQGNSFSLSVSFGIAVFPDHTEISEILIQKAHELPLIGRGRGGNKILFPEDKNG